MLMGSEMSNSSRETERGSVETWALETARTAAVTRRKEVSLTMIEGLPCELEGEEGLKMKRMKQLSLAVEWGRE